VIAGLVLVALVVTARLTRLRSARAGYLLVVVSLAWLVADKSVEGPTLVSLDSAHGLTAADLAGVVGLAFGIHQAWPDVVRRLSALTSRR
jgi:hypothetical protein